MKIHPSASLAFNKVADPTALWLIATLFALLVLTLPANAEEFTTEIFTTLHPAKELEETVRPLLDVLS